MKAKTIAQSGIRPLLIHNRRNIPLLLILEPWGSEILMPPDAVFQLRLSDKSDIPEVEFAEDRIVVYADHPVSIFHNGSELRYWEGDAFPFVPA